MSSPLLCISPFYAAVDQALSHSAHRLLVVLCGFADREGVCFPSRKLLTRITGIDNSNLSKYIKALCRQGYLKVLNQSANRYQIVGFNNKDALWQRVPFDAELTDDNQADGKIYHDHGKNYHLENQQDGNDYHGDGKIYHDDGKNYHETGDSVVKITNITDQQINRPLEQSSEQTSAVPALVQAALLPEPVKKSKPALTEVRKVAEDRFDKIFWPVYPHKKSKVDAIKAWVKLNPDDELIAVMIKAIENQVKEKKALKDAKQFCPEWPNPATWLNNRRWMDEITIISPSNSPSFRPTASRYQHNNNASSALNPRTIRGI